MSSRFPQACVVGVVALLAGSALAMVASGCAQDREPAIEGDAGPEASGPSSSVTVTAFAPTVTTAPAAKASATWAAYSLDDGEWRALMPAAIGTYVFPLPNARWALALACASDDDASSTVFIHHRTSATLTAEVMLEDFCVAPLPAAEFALTGNLLHVPTTTQWLDFGYARDSRGDVIPSMGNTVPYEEVNIAPGTWDLTFGIRDDAFGVLTRVVMRRGEVIKADKTLDIDVMGAGSFVPGQKTLFLRGITSGDTVTPHILYGAGGPSGIEMGPDDVPTNATDVRLNYHTIPEASQVASDRYRGTLGAEKDRRYDGRRITFDFHQAMELDLTFLPAAPDPVVKVLGVMPQVRLETHFATLANAARYEVRATAQINARTIHTWQSTFDTASAGGAPELVDTMPDLSQLAGFKASWTLPAGMNVTVLATRFEPATTLGDGTVQRSAGKAALITP